MTDTGELIATLERMLKWYHDTFALSRQEVEDLRAALRSGQEAEERLAEADAAINWLREHPYRPEATITKWCDEAIARHTARQQEGK